MKGRVIIAFIFVLLLISPYLGYGVNVEVIKRVDPATVNTGDEVNVTLLIINHFNKPITVKIVDKAIIDGSGYDVQCLEEHIDGGKQIGIIYPSIPVYSPGNYTLARAEVSYVNPNTGKKESGFSNEPYVVVKGKSRGSYARKTITTIYRCGGISMQSTSSSSSFSYSSSTFHISTSSSHSWQGQQNQITPTVPSQGNQNIQAIKKMLNKEIEREKRERERVLRNITSATKIKEMEKDLKRDGFKRVGANYNPKTNVFTLKYKNNNGDEAEIKGIYNHGEIRDVMRLTPKEKMKMLKELKRDRRYIKWNKKLREEGYNLTSISYQLNPMTNTTTLLLNYSKGEKKAQIIANYTANSIKKIVLKEEEGISHSLGGGWYKYILGFFGLLLLLTMLTLLVRKMKKNTQIGEVKKEVKKKRDEGIRKRRKAAWEHIRKAEKYVEDGKLKEAAEEISLAIRAYYSNIHGITKEVDSEEIVEILQEKGVQEVGKLKDILGVCDLLIFHPPHRGKVSEERVREILKEVKEIMTYCG